MHTSVWAMEPVSVFTRMSKLAHENAAINLAQGFPDFDGPDSIKKAAVAAITDGFNQYSPSAGLPELLQAIESSYSRLGFSYDAAEEITVFSGATEALFCSIQVLASFKDSPELITFEPFYDSYRGGCLAANMTLKGLPLNPDGWGFESQALESLISRDTVGILLNTPHNPSGKVFEQDELNFIAALAKKHDLIVISDEVYEQLYFDDAKHVRIANIDGMRERTITISSTSKNFSMTGWKVGYAFAPSHLTYMIRALHQYTVFCSATPLQKAMTEAFRLPDAYFETFRAEYAERRTLLVDLLRESGFKVNLPNGSYFIVADYSALSQLDDEKFCEELIVKHKVAAIPLSPFFADPAYHRRRHKLVRFGFCKDKPTIEEGGKRLKQAFS